MQRNPGHGHPLRPEYILTEAGRAAAARAATVALNSRVSAMVWLLPLLALPIVGPPPSRIPDVALLPLLRR